MSDWAAFYVAVLFEVRATLEGKLRRGLEVSLIEVVLWQTGSAVLAHPILSSIFSSYRVEKPESHWSGD